MNALSVLLVAVTLVSSLTASVIWCFCWKQLEHRFWFIVALGFMGMFVNALANMAAIPSCLNHTALALAALAALYSVFGVYSFYKKASRLRKALGMHPESESIAEKLAEHLVVLRSEIAWYERQAKINRLPLFPKH